MDSRIHRRTPAVGRSQSQRLHQLAPGRVAYVSLVRISDRMQWKWWCIETLLVRSIAGLWFSFCKKKKQDWNRTVSMFVPITNRRSCKRTGKKLFKILLLFKTIERTMQTTETFIAPSAFMQVIFICWHFRKLYCSCFWHNFKRFVRILCTESSRALPLRTKIAPNDMHFC